MARKDVLSGRERVRLALEHRETDRIPIALVCGSITAPARADLETYLRRERGISVDAYLKPLIDIKGVGPAYIGPPRRSGEDFWGVRREPVSYGAGTYEEIVHYPLAQAQTLADLDRHAWPRTDWFDYAALAEQIAASRKEGEYCLMVSNGNIFESSWYMRGFEQFFMDLALSPDLAHAVLERVTDFYIEHFAKMLAAAKGEIDLVFTADDIAGQEGLLLSLPMWEEFIKPCHQRMNRAIHEFGVKVIYHSDGAVMEAIPGLIEMGIDVLQALQFSAKGMDPAAMKRLHGDRLCFEGGVSVQTTLPFGSPKEVKNEVESHISVLGKNGGYILGPSHAIQAGTPPENIAALFDTAADFYPFH